MKTKIITYIIFPLILIGNEVNAEDIYTNQYDAIQNTAVGVISGAVGVFTETGSEAVKSIAVNPEAFETTVGEGIGTALVAVPALEATASIASIRASNSIVKAADQVEKSVQQVAKQVEESVQQATKEISKTQNLKRTSIIIKE